MSQRFRNRAGGLPDRDREIAFRFDGVDYRGFAGDSLASALLANGVRLVGRSFKYHRPRGIYSAGPEEPNALVELRAGARREPNTRATVTELFDGLEAVSQNRWPSLGFDLLAVNDLLAPLLPAGFYYKTFMWPRSFWEKLYEPAIRRAAGLGRASGFADPDRYQRATLHCDVLVVGAGPAGLAAALAASGGGARVVLAEQDHRVGGCLLGESRTLDGAAGSQWAEHARLAFEGREDTTLLTRTQVFGYYDHNVLGAVERVADHLPVPPAGLPRQRLWRIHAARVVLATGAVERPLVFAGNDRPGVMLAGAARAYANRYAVRPGARAVLFTNNSSGWGAARDLAAAGVEVATVVDSRRGVGERLTAALEGSGVRHHGGAMLRRVRGRLGVESVEIESGGVVERIDCDLLCVSGGWNPDVQLHSQTGARPRWDAGLAAFVPGESRQREVSVGGAAGAFDIGAALRQGAAAGAAAATDCGYRPATVELPAVDAGEQYRVEPLWQVPGTRGKALVDLQNDVTVSDIALAAREGFRSVEHLKRYTTLGMATDQGKLSSVNGLALLAAALERPIESLGTTTFRPPVSPVSLGVLAGSARGSRFAPTRRTPLHRWAERHDAVFVEAGQWLRPHYYPRPGEDLFAASVREARAVRTSVGICDVSTLGKIDLQGPDAGEFLDRLYCNNIRSLAVGRARYGLMLREDGLVLDDGTVSRLGETRYLVTTTTAEAAAVMAHMEFYHQAVWPELDVRYASVTEQWAAMAVAGPDSRRVLERVLDGFDLRNDAFPFMAATELPLGGFTARLFRISFSGELAYELCVPAGYGESVWQALVEAGAGHGITPYGTEALGILRIEKGHVAAAEINGQTTAADLGLGRMMSTAKDYVGRVLAGREALLAADREQLVGLRCLSPENRLYAGAHLLARGAEAVAANDLGHVTSVTYSPALDCWIALALLRGGRERHGETLRAVSPLHRHDVEVEVVSPYFHDPENERLHG